MARNLIDLAYDEDLYDDYLDEEQDNVVSKKISSIHNKINDYPQYDNRRKQDIRSKRREKENMREKQLYENEKGEYDA